MNDRVYTITELTRLFKRSRQTIYTWYADGRFPNAYKTGEDTAAILVPGADVERVRREEAEQLMRRLRELGFPGEAIPA
jgi:hypothetical protein